MIIRKAKDRGHVNAGWLDSYHSFSFGDYYDPAHMGFGDLRVINDDVIAPAAGFPAHPHRDMEIVTYILEGALQHRDSLGTGSVIQTGDVQKMSAGTGIRHSEFNASQTERVHLLQIWILPEKQGLEPGYQQKHFPRTARDGKLQLVGSRNGRDDSIIIHQDISIYASILKAGQGLDFEIPAGRSAWLQMAKGNMTLNGAALEAGDGVAFSTATKLHMQGVDQAEFLLFEMKGV